MEGKHSETQFTCKELEDGLQVFDDSAKIAAFNTLFSETANSRYSDKDCKWIGATDIISLMEDAWQEEII
jgi:hypothetical protein